VAIETTRLMPIKRTRSILVTTRAPEMLEKIGRLLDELDRKPTAENASVQIVRVVNSEAKVLAETLNKLVVDRAKSKKDKDTVKTDEITFAADEHTNSLIVTGPSQIFAQYEAIIKALDIMRPQILVEVLITEVSGNLSKSMGIEWGYIDADKTHARAYGQTNFGLESQALTGTGMQVGLLKGPLDMAKALNNDIVELSKIKALMRVYQNNSEFNILSAPQLLATDNEEAKIIVGEVVALPQGFTKDRDSGRFDLTNFKYEDVGITLNLKPRVNSNELVTLKLNQEVKKRQEENLYEFSVPVLTKRQMETTITVPNHETIVIGGLMREDKTMVEDRIPVLANLPLIGPAFRSKRRSVQKTNLLVFLTPHILSTPQEVADFDLSSVKQQRDSAAVRGEKPPVKTAPVPLAKQRESMRTRAQKVFSRFKAGIAPTGKATGH
jgi:general secretion pathway protein D